MDELLLDVEFRGLIPPLQTEELKGLEDSLIREGNRDPIVIWKEQRIILDGHTRYDLCHRHGIELKTPHEISFPDRDEVKLWIIRNQFGRRNLSPYQRSVLALRMMEILEEKAKKKEQYRKTVEQASPLPPALFRKCLDIMDDVSEKCRNQPGANPEPKAINSLPANTETLKAAGATPDYAYFIQAGDKIKIGCSCDPEGRLKDIARHESEAKLIGYCKGGQRLETELHGILKDHLAHNEWYKIDYFTVSAIKSFIPEADFVQMDKVNSRQEATTVFDVGAGTIARVKVIEEKATPEQKTKLASGEATVNQVYLGLRREEVKQRVKDAQWPTGKYRVIYADPPWQYSNSMPVDIATTQDDHYPTMPVSEICLLPVKDLALDNSVLFLWATSPILQEAFKVFEAWGFRYKASFIWDKVKHNMGHYNSVRHEFLLVAVRGSCQPDSPTLYDSVQSIERGEHSHKPSLFRQIIQSLYPYGPRIELFARDKTEGWVCYGNQI